jgi:hypothetical protein
MENEKKEVETKEVDTTTNQNASTDETKTEEPKVDTPENPEDEKVTLSKKELEDLKKRALDYDRSIELKRLKKLEEKGEFKTPEDKDELNSRIEKIEQELTAQKANTFNSNLTEAYRAFVSDNPWANDDAKFDKIKENFNSVGTETKDELQLKLKIAAQTAFPTEYEKHLEDKIKSNLFKDKSNMNTNSAAGSGDILHKEDDAVKTEEQKRKERLGALLRENMPWLNKK